MGYVEGSHRGSTLGGVNSTVRMRILLVLLALASCLLVVQTFGGEDSPQLPSLTYTELDAQIDLGLVESVQMTQGSTRIIVETVDGERYRAVIPPGFIEQFVSSVVEAQPQIQLDTLVNTSGPNPWLVVLNTVAPLALMVILVVVILGRLGGGRTSKKKFRKQTLHDSEGSKEVTFADVAGADEAVTELTEIREFLNDAGRFSALGAKIPKGVLLYGPPGTGKTLLARAVAGEAGVPFFTLSGSDFVEKFAGVGAGRVRDLFDQARKDAPAIIFVDEIDAVGRHRGGGGGAGNEEREQTLNQLLVEMDGFDVSSGVIFIAATNRPDILDKALLRPGRFDRQIAVDIPDINGRRQIAAVHATGKPLAPGVSIETIARRTPGFTGADIANLLNEAALLSARRNLTHISQAELDDALDRVIAGPEKANTLSEKERHTIAYHEAGHALVGHLLPNCDPIHKVSIIARGKALGWTLALPERDRVMKTQSELCDEMAMLLGGRVAEELIFRDPTTGASNDIERVTAIARSMVTEYGMSALGPQRFGRSGGEVYAPTRDANYSDDVAMRIDEATHQLIDRAAAEAREVLSLHRPVLDKIADALIEHETIGHQELDVLFSDLGPVIFRREEFTPPLRQEVLDLR